MSNNQNPFLGFFNGLNEQNLFAANVNADAYIEAWRLNAKAFTEISESILDHAYELSTAQVKIVQKNAEDLANFFKEMSDTTTKPEDKVARQADFVKTAVESTLKDSKELAEKAVKQGTVTGEVINKGTTAVFSELSKSNQPKNAKKDKQAA
tara:strand:+ start:640 stop:1095 length:456 start_codon:yes stop_codon:yes gene_type:complete